VLLSPVDMPTWRWQTPASMSLTSRVALISFRLPLLSADLPEESAHDGEARRTCMGATFHMGATFRMDAL